MTGIGEMIVVLLLSAPWPLEGGYKVVIDLDATPTAERYKYRYAYAPQEIPYTVHRVRDGVLRIEGYGWTGIASRRGAGWDVDWFPQHASPSINLRVGGAIHVLSPTEMVWLSRGYPTYRAKRGVIK